MLHVSVVCCIIRVSMTRKLNYASRTANHQTQLKELKKWDGILYKVQEIIAYGFTLITYAKASRDTKEIHTEWFLCLWTFSVFGTLTLLHYSDVTKTHKQKELCYFFYILTPVSHSILTIADMNLFCNLSKTFRIP